jgi:hypothetical protein
MTELERRLADLGGALDLPEPGDLAPAVLAGLAEPPRRPWLRPLAVAVAALATAVGIAFAVPQARSAILDWLGFGGVEIRTVATLPETTASPDLGLGSEVTLAEARRRAAFPVAVPTALGPPHEVRFTDALPGGQVGLVWSRPDSRRPRILLTQFRADGLTLIEKATGPETRMQRVTVGDSPGVWLEGDPHFFAYLDPRTGDVIEDTSRLAGNVLLWQRGDVTLRLEGAPSKQAALAIARSAG